VTFLRHFLPSSANKPFSSPFFLQLNVGQFTEGQPAVQIGLSFLVSRQKHVRELVSVSISRARKSVQFCFGRISPFSRRCAHLQQPILVGYDWGARAACTTAALWPAKVGGLIPIGGYNVESFILDREPAPAQWEYKGWYQWYFQTERGRAGLQRNRRDISRLLWELWCPNWKFTDATFDETACSFDNPDFVDIVIHSYRYRHGAAVGDPNLETIERQLSTRPTIGAPTIVLHGEGDTIHPPEMSEAQEKLFSAHYERRVIPLAGHLFPREAPGAVITAVLDLSRIRGLRPNPRI